VSSPAIRTEGLTREFGRVRAVDRLSIDVGAGEIFGFLGPNGAGKTTTIHLLLGLLVPTAGRAEVLGLDTREHSGAIREQVGTLLEHSGVYEQLTAEENLEFWGRVWHLSAADRRDRIRELLTAMNVWDRRTDLAGTWSRGMKQRLALARVLLHRPALVFLDEPTAGLDVLVANEVRDDLAALAEREGTTIFLTTHNMTEAEQLCSHVAVIHEGALLAIGPPDQLKSGGGAEVIIRGRGFTEQALVRLRSRAEVRAAFLRDRNLVLELDEGAGTGPLVSLLVECGASVEEVLKGKPSLEQTFLNLVRDEEES